MTTINKKLIHFEKLSDFKARLAAGDIQDRSIVWIKDAKLIWTHGVYYAERSGGSVLKFTNVQATEWVTDSTYSDFQYRCDVACQGATPDSYADVAFSLSQATSGIYAPVCDTGENIVSIWSSSNEAIIIPTILITL